MGRHVGSAEPQSPVQRALALSEMFTHEELVYLRAVLLADHDPRWQELRRTFVTATVAEARRGSL